MEGQAKDILALSVEEREEVLAHLAETLEGSAWEAWIEGQKNFAIMSRNMAAAIKQNVDELARDEIQVADRMVRQALDMLAHFRTHHPYRPVSLAIH